MTRNLTPALDNNYDITLSRPSDPFAVKNWMDLIGHLPSSSEALADISGTQSCIQTHLKQARLQQIFWNNGKAKPLLTMRFVRSIRFTASETNKNLDTSVFFTHLGKHFYPFAWAGKKFYPFSELCKKNYPYSQQFDWYFITKIKGKIKREQAKPPKFSACGGLKKHKNSLIQSHSAKKQYLLSFFGLNRRFAAILGVFFLPVLKSKKTLFGPWASQARPPHASVNQAL